MPSTIEPKRDKKIGVAIVGTGFGSSAQIPAFLTCPDVQVVAVCSRDSARAAAAAAQFGIPSWFSDYDDLLKHPDIDAVSIVTPPYLHLPMTLAALSANKHILCEKPMAMNLDEASQMYRAAEQKQVVHVVDHELRFNPTRTRMRELIREGFVGKIYHCTVYISSDYRADPLLRTWDWWSDAAQGGGSVGATASHPIDLLRWCVGEIRSVAGQLKTFVTNRKLPDSDELRTVSSEDECAFLLEFESGAVGSVFITSVVRQAYGTRMEIHGEAGSLILDAEERLWGRRAGEKQVTEFTLADPNRDLPGIAKNVWNTSFVGLAQAFAESVRTGTLDERAASFYDGVRCQAVMGAIRQSWAERRWVEVPLPL